MTQGDMNTRRRRLSQSNVLIAQAITFALSQAAQDTQAANAPTQLDVLGFDACLMQAFGAVEDYQALTKYYLASEAVEPGSGKLGVNFIYTVSGEMLNLSH